MLLPDWLERRAHDRADTLALQVGQARWSFADLHEQVGRQAGALVDLGIQPGDRVAVLLRNGLEFAQLAHAVGRCGAVLVPLNTRLTPVELAWQITDVGANLLLYDPPDQPAAQALRESLPALSQLPVVDLRLSTPPPGRLIDTEAVHSVIYTSGTTGTPKGAMLTYGNFWWSAAGSAFNLGLRQDDRWLAVLPLFHVGGLSILLRSAIYGCAAIVHPAFDPAAVNRAIDEDGVTIVSVVATMLQRMLDERGDHPYPSTFRCALLGGGPAPRPLLEACAALGVPVVQTYGLTETASQTATLAPADALRKLGSAGQPLLPTELHIERADGSSAAPGEAGEIVVRGPTVTLGYVNRPDATARAIRDGWLHTGDVGTLDAEGYLYVLDRRDDIVISGGENVYPAEVEAVLLAHPAVAEAGVIGAPDPIWGQVPVAFVVPRGGASPTLADLTAHCTTRLAGYKVPRQVIFVDALPRNAAGKLLRSALRARL
jgi:O-succinylbenzoic acid--CoA ligase